MPEPLTDPREMRKAIKRAARGETLSGDPCKHLSIRVPALTRNILTAAEYLGYSGEDAMTCLAYHALLEIEQATERELDILMSTPSAPIILRKEG